MNHIMAFCDQEYEYTYQLAEYLKIEKNFPCDIELFSSFKELEEYKETRTLDVVFISESIYSYYKNQFIDDTIIILSECGSSNDSVVPTIYKYQSGESIYKEILKYLVEHKTIQQKFLIGNHSKLIGIYSPIGRCFKSSFSYILSQILGKKSNVLYLNLEVYSGLSKLLEKEFSSDISNLLFFLQNKEENFEYRIQSIVEKIGSIDIIPPFYSPIDLQSIEKNEWIALFNTIESYSNYEYVILDLSDSIQGLYDILRACDLVYTVTDSDEFAKAKILQYEDILEKYNYEDVKKKTKKVKIPRMHHLPKNLMQLPHSELAEYVKQHVKEDFSTI